MPVFEPSQTKIIEDAGIKFEVGTISAREWSKPRSKNSENPFLPPFEPNVFISDLEPNHRLIFNKYSVAREHVLVLTKDVQEQTDPLTKDDFQACLTTITSLDAVMFFNCGRTAGSSQKHKHM